LPFLVSRTLPADLVAGLAIQPMNLPHLSWIALCAKARFVCAVPKTGTGKKKRAVLKDVLDYMDGVRKASQIAEALQSKTDLPIRATMTFQSPPAVQDPIGRVGSISLHGPSCERTSRRNGYWNKLIRDGPIRLDNFKLERAIEPMSILHEGRGFQIHCSIAGRDGCVLQLFD
jgi:hypothetical protein